MSFISRRLVPKVSSANFCSPAPAVAVVSRVGATAISSFPICNCAKCAGAALDLDLGTQQRCMSSFGAAQQVAGDAPAKSLSVGHVGHNKMMFKSHVGTSSCSLSSSNAICRCPKCATGGRGSLSTMLSGSNAGFFTSGTRGFGSSAATAGVSSSPLQSIGTPKDIAMDDARRKGLAWRAKQRGWLELDWLVGTFAQKYLANLNEVQLDKFEELLECDNPDLFNWLSAQEPAPEHMMQNEVYLMMAEYVNAEHPNIMKSMEGNNQNLG